MNILRFILVGIFWIPLFPLLVIYTAAEWCTDPAKPFLTFRVYMDISMRAWWATWKEELTGAAA